MGVIWTPPKTLTRQPQGRVELADKFYSPDALAYVAGQRRWIGGEYEESGITHSTSPLGLSSTSSTSGRINLSGNYPMPSFGTAWVFCGVAGPFSGDDGYVSGVVSDGAPIEDAGFHGTETSPVSGGLGLFLRDSSNRISRFGSAGGVHPVGEPFCAVFLLIDRNEAECYVDGRSVSFPIEQEQNGGYLEGGVNSDRPLALLNRNLRGSYSKGGNFALSMWARLSDFTGDPVSISANPWQIFQAPVNRTIFLPAATGTTLANPFASNITTNSITPNVDVTVN